jgi:agmatine deiminase
LLIRVQQSSKKWLKIALKVNTAAILFIAASVILSRAAVDQERYTYPAEWEPHDAIWIGFRTTSEGLVHEEILQQMLKALSPHVSVKVVVEDRSLLPEGELYFSLIGLDPSAFAIIEQNPVDFWFRDPGPLFLVKNKRHLGVADFLFSNYQNVVPQQFSPKAQLHQTIDKAIAHRLVLPLFESRAVLEGGAFEVNGNGTVLLTGATKQRNPHLSLAELESEILTTLGQQKIVWLADGLAEDPLGFTRIVGKYWGRGAGGHTDEFIRFVDDTTVLLAWPSDDEKNGNHPLNSINSSRLVRNKALLEKATNQDGKPFSIIKFPVPDPLITPYRINAEEIDIFRKQDSSLKEGDTIFLVGVASYLNYVISNEVILLPAYWKEGKSSHLRKKDQMAKDIMQRYFPDRKIIQIDPTSLNFYGGGMHCITQQQPKIP